MPRTIAARQYGKPSKRNKAERLFAELPQSPVRQPPVTVADPVTCIADQLSALRLEKESEPTRHVVKLNGWAGSRRCSSASAATTEGPRKDRNARRPSPAPSRGAGALEGRPGGEPAERASQKSPLCEPSLRVLTWDDVCPPGDDIVKIAEASYAEVYRVSNERGTSIIKVIRLESPIKPQTKTQAKSGLVDEEPHSQDDVDGELQISEWLADIPGFVVYKERYVVQGKATKQLLETHQAFQRRLKRQDPGRAQFYPSPSRYVHGTRFLAVELGDAGTALEDWELADESQLWDIFLLQAVALARAEDMTMFEVRRGLPPGSPLTAFDESRSIETCTRATSASSEWPPRGGGTPGATDSLATRASTSQSWTTGCRELKTCRWLTGSPSRLTWSGTSASSRARTRLSAPSTARCGRFCCAATASASRPRATGRRMPRGSMGR